MAIWPAPGEVEVQQFIERIDRLSPAKRELLAKRRSGHLRADRPSLIPKQSSKSPVPLTSSQHGVWVLDKLHGRTPLCNVSEAFRLSGVLDLDALRYAMQVCFERHDLLRSRVVGSIVPHLEVMEEIELPFGVIDLSDRDADEVESLALRLANEQAATAFDISKPSLGRVTLIRVNAELHLLVIVVHHLIGDGWSLGIFVREIQELYAAVLERRPHRLSANPIQFSDYAAWLATLQAKPDSRIDELVESMASELAGAPALVTFPPDTARPAVFDTSGRSYRFSLGAGLNRRLSEFGNRLGVSKFTILLASFALLLGRFSGQKDVVIGSPTANRRHVETRSMIGMFVNTLVYRIGLSGSPSFAQLVRQVWEVSLRAFSRQHVPFDHLLERLGVQRDPSFHPLFQTVFVYDNWPRPPLRFPGINTDRIGVHSGTARFDLFVVLEDRDDELDGWIEYSTALHSPETIERIARSFERLLLAAVGSPERPVDDLPLLSDTDLDRLLVEWNDTAVEYRRDACIHDLFAEQVSKTPDAVAVIHEDRRLTYGELDRRSSQLAHHLRDLEVGPEVVVGLLVERSAEMVVGLLGILKAGGAYLPLDPSYPPERLAHMLTDVRAPLLVTQAGLEHVLPEHGIRVVRLDANWKEIAAAPTTMPAGDVLPDNLAYVTYTSGSTGQPKGVMTKHRSVVNYLSHMIGTYDIAADAVLQIPTFSFDASVRDLVGPLLVGGRTILLAAGEAKDPRALMAKVVGEQVTAILSITPSLLANIISYGREAGTACPFVRLILCSGEALHYEHCQGVLETFGKNALVVNQYGPTECTMTSSYFKVSRLGKGSENLPLGRPIANAQFYVLDGNLHAVPAGVVGNLYIGGTGLSRGYWGRPGLTAERFIPDPFGQGERLYHSGDLARWRGDANLQFFGRVDHQVKVRGNRVELYEIEARLLDHPGVRQAVVVVREDAGGGQRLVAYVVAQQGEAPEPNALRVHLKKSLPDYMEPSAFVTLAALPLTPNGKVDRTALPAPEGRPEIAAYAGPRTPIEEALVGIWCEVLRLDRVGVHDNFFDLGGNSLLTIRLVARVREAFDVDLPLPTFFEATNLSVLAERIDAVRRAGAGLKVPALLVQSRPERLPLSFAQERLWVLEQLAATGAAYHIHGMVRLAGALDFAALERAFAALVGRHEALRTRFVRVDGSPVQVIDAAVGFRLGQIDLTVLDAEERGAAARQRAREIVGAPFDLECGPLLRAMLLRLSAEEHLVVMVLHHIVADGWSLGILIREIAALYAAFIEGQPSQLPDLPVQYADYALWQRAWLSGDALDRQVRYWKDRLCGAPAALDLPIDHVRPAVQSFTGTAHGFRVSQEVTAALVELGRAEGATLFMVLLGAFQVVLSRWSGQTDIVVGTPIAGRTHRDMEGLIGFFVNTLVMRTDLSGEPSFRGLLKRVKEVALGAYVHQDLPLEKLVQELQPVRDLSRHPVFQVLFALQNVSQERLELPGLQLTGMGGEHVTAKFDLSLYIEQTEHELQGRFEYATDLFDAATIGRLVGHFETLLKGIVAAPDSRISALPLLGDAERRHLVTEWNATAAEYPCEKCLHELFARQAANAPDSVAVVYADQCLTYAELDRRANQLAHHLCGLGVGPEVVVGLLVERSPEMVVGLLGILKAGGAYLPLDPSYPLQRLAYMLTDARAAVLVTQAGLEHVVREHGARVVRLDANWEEITAEPAEAPRSDVNPDHLAYVIYTSGSTGRPKGVMVGHAALVNFLSSMAQTLGLAPSDVLAAVTPLSFDIAGLEIYLPLLQGGRLVVIPRDVALEGRRLREGLEAVGAGVMQATPVTWRLLLEAGWDGKRLKVLCGGEALAIDLAQSLTARSASVWNLYGPTETTVWSTASRLVQGGHVTIGRPISNTQAYVLDPSLQPTPIGVCGELYLGGASLSRGYLSGPGMTAERFVPSPFGNGVRLYRSGDLARWRADGELLHLGRVDHQMKIRGFRVEPGEIEAALRRAPGVIEVAVVAREDAPGERRLVAYVVTSDGTADGRALRAHLQRLLPDYMVPSAYTALAVLPATPNGKLDRSALPLPEGRREVGAYVSPETPVQAALAEIWSDVLQVERIGIHDDFFQLGGHSLLAIRVIARLSDTLDLELPLRALFEASTVAELAARIEAAQQAGNAVPLRPLVRQKRPAALPLSFAQQRLWFLDQLGLVGSAYNMPAAFRLQGPVDVTALERSLGEVTRRHEALRTRIEVRDGQAVQVVDEPGFRLDVVDLPPFAATEREARAQQLAREDAVEPFDLVHGPLFRAKLVRLDAEHHVLLANMHHIVSDGWSADILVHEVTELYAAYVQGKPSPLPDLPIQYADYALWQRGWLTGEALDRQIAYWRRQLAGAPAAIDLPADHPRPAVQSFKGARHAWALSSELSSALLALSRREGVTLYILLLAAFSLLLGRYSGQHDIVIGSPTAGRRRQELEGMIGFFVNTLVLRTDLSGNPSFRELLRREKETVLGAFAHQDLPFERLVEELQPIRDLSRQPVFQIELILQNIPQGTPELEMLKLSRMEGTSVTTKFDLSLQISETPSGLQGHVEYATDLFEASTVERLIGHLTTLLNGIVARPDSRICDLPLLSEMEWHQLLVVRNNTGAEFPRDKCLHELFAEQVARTPDAVAVIFFDKCLTYRALDHRSNQLAHHLRDLGVGPDVMVGLCLERSLEMIVGLLGILKAGGAYLPLDPSHPLERLAYMLTDAGAPVVVTQAALAERLPRDVQRILLAGHQATAGRPTHPPVSAVQPDNLAYVIYTSGSTGRPKGVMMPHRSLVNLLEWSRRETPDQGMRSILQAASVGFDVAPQEIFTALQAGSTIVLIDDEDRRDARRLAAAIEQHRVTDVFLTFHALHAMAALPAGLPRLTSIRNVVTSGDRLACDPTLRDCFDALPDARLHNQYGPTETHVVTGYRLASISSNWPALPPIGRPIANARVYVLDARLEPVPIGVVGELYVGGIAPARGYLRNPRLTAGRFVPSPFVSGERLYRTGDLCRWQVDGELVFMGRTDHQVKIRGHRIELEEIEVALLDHPDVRQAVVMMREVAGDRRLIAFVVLAQPLEMTAELRRHLSRRLPDYMVPTAFVMRDALPLTTNGKVDRQALSAYEAIDDRRREYIPPRSPTECLVATVWQDVLGLERVDIADNFFDLGGHSLSATRVLAHLQSVLDVDLPLRALFEAPTVAELAERVELAQRAGDATTVPALVPRERPGALPLSFAQERLWLVEALLAAGAAYTIATAVRLEGPLNVGALERSFAELERRHEALRTRFATADGQLVQVIDPPGRFRLVVEDLSNLPAATPRLREREHAQVPFDLAAGPLFRASLLRLVADDHVLLVAMHHIVSDGWSIAVLIRELGALYAAFATGQPSPLAELPVQYADYALWQREWLTGAALAQQVDYWKKHLSGASAALALSADRPRPAMQSFAGATLAFGLSRALSMELSALGRREGATLFMVLLGAFQVLLGRYSGQEDIVVGSPIAGRRRRELEGLIGCFVNTLVLRTDLSRNPSFRELLGRVKKGVLGAYAHQDLPFEKLVEELHPLRDLSRQPLFQVMFVLQNMPQEMPVLPGLRVSQRVGEDATAKVDLSLYLEETEQGLRGSFEYATDLFDAATVERMAGHFEALLKGIVAAPDSRLADLPLLSEAEQRRVVVEWNDVATEYPADRCLHELFAEQVNRTPDAAALIHADQHVTYGELDRRANQLAHHLRARGVGPEVVVGLLVERSAEMAVGLLAILKAGGVYLPLDPSHPAERLAYMLTDARAAVLVTQAGLEHLLPEYGAKMVRLDTDRPLVASEPTSAPSICTAPDNLAYIIYTSGSTGWPKGVMSAHRATVNRIAAQAAIDPYTGDDVCCLKTSIGFVDSIFEIFGPLLNGVPLIVGANAEGNGLELLTSLIEHARVTRLITVPSLASAILAEPNAKGRLARLRSWTLSGEALSADLLRLLSATVSGCRLANLYGSSEVAADATCYIAQGWEGGAVPIGRPLPNVQTYVIDARLQPGPIGTAGELCIGGVGLSRGYFARPELTAERFVPNPFGSGERLYRSGDFARWRPDGKLEYLGRVDHQVKVRGHRIELGEVEAILHAYVGVRQAVVTAREDDTGDKRLVAYVVGTAELAQPDALRKELRQRLPDYMVPAAFVMLDELPLTPNGKVDRRALPAPPGPPEVGVCVDPRTPTEDVLASIWCHALKIDRVGVNDDFFDLGGHSLLAMRVISLVREAFGVELSLRELFEASSIARLGDRVDAVRHAGAGLTMPALLVQGRPERLPLSFAQERLWLLEELEATGAAYTIATAALLQGLLDVDTMERSFAELERRHEALRTRFAAVDGEPLQVVDPPGRFRFAVEDLSHLPPVSRAAVLQARQRGDAQAPFDLMAGPLFRAKLLRLAADDHVLLVAMHHIVSDGWSIAVLIRELGALYAAFATGQPSPLAELPVQYADYALWQRGWLHGAVLERQVGYWRDRLAGAPGALELPTDGPRPAVQSFAGAAVSFVLPHELTTAVTELGRREGATLFMVLLAAFQVALWRWSGQTDVVVGTPIAGRTHREMEGLIGFFVNMLALRTDLSGDPTFRGLLARVKGTALGAYAHQDLPFEKLVEELQPVRDLSRQPIFQVALVLQTVPVEPLTLPGLRLSRMSGEQVTSKLDLSLYFEQLEGELRGTLEYATDLFERATIERLVGHLETLLRGVVANPDCRISALPLLTEGERQQLLVAWNATTTDYPGDSCVHELVSAQAVRTPDAVALVHEDRQISYGDLERLSNQLAHHLRGLGVGAETIVGLCVERSPEMMVGLLGILKAGGAYLPLDPSYPADRLAYMLIDAQAAVVVTQAALAGRLVGGAQRVLLDGDRATIAAYPTSAPISGARPDNLAYVIYTSGSTGRPKGVCIEQRAVVNYLRWASQAFATQYGSGSPVSIPLAFDMTISSLYLPLLAGTRVILPREGDELPLLQRLLRSSEDLTFLKVTPSHVEYLNEVVPPRELAGRVRWLIAGGEALTAATLQPWRDHAPGTRLINAYGPTETVVACSIYEIGLDDPAHGPVPIGRPIANTRFYIMDRHGGLAPVGIAGELCIGGAGLARGYLGLPGLTAERFVPSPFANGERLYRSGDLTCWRSDGNVEFLGRLDEQVKVRGFRIEPGEVEAVLMDHVAIHQAVVTSHGDGGHERRLAAYVVLAHEISAAALRTYLQARLPAYMVPSAIVMLPKMPLTSNGKIDRRALSIPETGAPVIAFVAPRTPTETVLAKCWADLLQVQRVGSTDNFFELGGNSLSAARLAARVGELLDAELPLRAIFESPVLGDLAERIDTMRWHGQHAAEHGLVDGDGDREVGAL
jgi:amino acid adenylation domain-containing protein